MNKALRTLCRYILLLAVVLLAYTNTFYKVFFSITAYPIKFLLLLFYDAELSYSTLYIGDTVIDLIPACIAVSAYVLLIILNLTTEIKPRIRVYSLLFSLLSLLILNILRVFVLTILLVNDFVYFEAVHKFFWYGLSTVFVVAIWFLTAYLFKIKNIPAYGDFLNIKKEIKRK